MKAHGRPFRFLAAVCVGWIGLRILFLWPQTGSLGGAIDALLPTLHKPSSPASAAPPKPVAARTTRVQFPQRPEKPTALRLAPLHPMIPPLEVPEPVRYETAALPPELLPIPPQTLASPRSDLRADRWSASGWLVARSGNGAAAAPGGQLGGGQAGIRIAYLLLPQQRVTIFARVTTPLAGKGRETVLGLDWQPTTLPLRIVAEQRVGLDGTPGGTGLGVVGGLYAEASGFRVEGYGQAGIIARTRTEPYADGAIRITRPVAPRITLGVGAWGGAQRDAQRLDIGPSASLNIGPARLSLEWRQRIAGRARPGSGLALTLGGDF